MNNLRIGDKVTVKISDVTIMRDGEITNIEPTEEICKVYWADSDLHFWVEFRDLLPPF